MNKPKRKNIRLETWDYSNHAYYHVTVCTDGRACLLSTISQDDHKVLLTDIGEAVEQGIEYACEKYPSARVETYVIMPNHMHLLVAIDESDIALGKFIGCIKSRATRLARQHHPDLLLWQRNFYDHILRGEQDYHDTWQYIEDNPAKWTTDVDYLD